MSQVQSLTRHESTKQPGAWLDSRLLDAARLAFICGIFAAVWGIGGHYPTSRFVTLALLGVSSALLCLPSSKSEVNQGNTILFFLIVLTALTYGLLQLLPQSFAPFLDWTGVREVQVRFGAEPTDASLTQSLVAWMTQSWLAMAVIGFAGFFMATQLFTDDQSRILLLVSIAICGIGQVMWGIVQLTAYPDMIFYGVENPSSTSVPFGTFLNRNHAADFIGVSLACALGVVRARSLSNANRWRSGYGVASQFQSILTNPLTLAIWLGVIWLMLGQVLSMSRGGWVSALVAVVVVVFSWKRSGKKSQFYALIAAMLAITIAFFGLQLFGFGDQVGDRIDDLEVQNVLSDSRFDHWAEALPAVAHFFPFGSGVGTYGYAYLPFEPEPLNRWFTHAHNQYLEVLVEAGLPGIILVLLGMVVAFRSTLVLCDDGRSASKQALGVAALAAVVIHAFHALTDFGLMMPGNLIVLAALIGAACAAGPKRTRQKRRKLRSQTTPESVSGYPSIRGSEAASRKPIWERFLTPTAMSFLVLASLCGAIWQQGRHVSATRLLSRTEFSEATPSPTVQVSGERTEALREELARWPAFEPVQRRIIRLQTHQSRRNVYDQIRKSDDPIVSSVDPLTAWNSTSLNSVIARLYDDSEGAPGDDAKAQVQAMMLADPDLNAAWDNVQYSIALNSLQPRTHLQAALIACATGRPWRSSFDRSMQLAVYNNDHSFGNGLLAWASGDKESMIAQWKRSLSTNSDSIELIYRLSRFRLNDQEIVNDLMPERWVVPFRLSQRLRKEDGTDEVRRILLARAKSIAQKQLTEPSVKHKTLGMIASANGDLSSAFNHYDQAIKSDPQNSQLRHLAAVTLYRSGNAKHAEQQAYVATLLDPKNAEYRKLHRQATKLLRQQYPNSPKLSNDSSRTQPE